MPLLLDKPTDTAAARPDEALVASPLAPRAVETPAPRPLEVPVPRGLPRRWTLKDRALAYVAGFFNDCCGPREKHAFGILMYHRIANPVAGQPRPTWNVPPAVFERQLSGLLRRGWVAWPLSQILNCLERDLPIPRQTFVVTFDDGYANNFTQALPILTRLRVPATVFVATAYLDTTRPFPSDDWTAAGQPGVPSETWRPLTTDECRRLTASGLVELGAHTHTHGDFRGRPEALFADLQQNLEVLEKRFDIERPAFALPYGTKADGFAAPALASIARQLGTVCSLTTEADLVRPGDSPFDWGRFAVEEHDTPRTLAARLGGWHNFARRVGRLALRRRTGS